MRIIRKLIIINLILILRFSPMITSLTGGYIAKENDCVLHEGFANPCFIVGHDPSDQLYKMAVAGWLTFFTVPMGIFILLV